MEAILKINNDYSYLITNNLKLREVLWNNLRFRKLGYFHTRAYKQGIWDGFIQFFDKKTGKFLTGLLLEVKLVLNHLGVQYEVNDERNLVNFTQDTIDESFLPGLTLYDYQIDLVNKALKYKRGIIQAPTSAGKTAMMLSIMRALPPNTPTLFLAHRKTLISQNYQEMKNAGFKNVGRFYSDYHEPDVITCCTIQSAHHLEKQMSKFEIVIADEIHKLSNDSAFKVFKKLKNASIRIAVSATPFKFGGKDDVQKYAVKGYFGPIFKTSITESGVLTTSYLQERGNLSDSICTFIKVKSPQLPYDIFFDAVTNGIADNMHFHQMVTKLAGKLKGRTLILIERLTQGDILHSLIPNSLWVQGKDNEQTRSYVIEQLKKAKGNVVAIASQGIFSEGVNFFVHNLINASGGKAEHEIIQRMGRGLRTKDDKSILNYYDFLFEINPYLDDHSNQRIKILKKEKHEVIIKDEIDF